MGEYESCLSDPWNVAFVARPQTIGIGYIDGFGKYKEEERLARAGVPARVRPLGGEDDAGHVYAAGRRGGERGER